MSVINDLKKAIVGRKEISGSVVAVTNAGLKISTSMGIIETQGVGAQVYKAGDKVKLENGIVVGKMRSDASRPVYYV